jgi:hypothetical protein
MTESEMRAISVCGGSNIAGRAPVVAVGSADNKLSVSRPPVQMMCPGAVIDAVRCEDDPSSIGFRLRNEFPAT